MDSAAISQLFANQAKLEFDETAKSWPIISLPGNVILDMVVVKIDTAFDSAVSLGNASDDDAYIVTGDFPKTVGLHDPIILGIPLASGTAIKLKTAGNTTGAGTIWITWRPLK